MNGPAWSAADAEALRRVLEEATLDTEVPTAGPSEYVADALGHLVAAIRSWIAGLFPEGTDLVLVERLLVIGLATLSVMVAVWLLAGVVRRWWDRRSEGGVAAEAATVVLPDPSVAPPRPAAWWWQQVEGRLAAADPRGAAEALWWWIARTLDPPGLGPSWTSGDLLAATRRSGLGPALRRLDRAQYGPGTPGPGEIAGLAAELRQRLP